MDTLTTLLNDLTLKCAFHVMADFSAPWSVHIEQDKTASLHFVLEGECYVELDTGDTLHFEAGDLLLLPRGAARTLSDRAGRTPIHLLSLLPKPIEGWYAQIEHGGGGKKAHVCGGMLHLAHASENQVFQALPDWILVQSEELNASVWLTEHLRCLFDEATAGRPGGGMMVAKMSEIIFLHALRVYLTRDDNAQHGFFRALREPRLSQVIQAIHLHPEHPWTVASLAKKAHMSRAAFAARFARLLEQTPIEYLTRVRIAKAAQLLRDSQDSILDIALQVGYQTQASLSTAFRKQLGQPPGQYRKKKT